MILYAWNILINHRLRVGLTTLSISLCVMLMLFLLSIYHGAEYGSVEYVRSGRADFWVLQKHATNILRSTSILPYTVKNKLESMDGIRSANPVLFILVSVKTAIGPASVYLTGYDPSSGIGGPPELIAGKQVEKSGEIVLDRAFASKYRIRVGDSVMIKDDPLVVTGISDGTNMFVIQYAFVSIEQAWSVIGLRNVVSCFQVIAEPGAEPGGLAENMKSNIRDVGVFDRKTFFSNNLQEMQSGLIPLLFMVAAISAIVLTAILSLILSVNVIEQRGDYAIMKALGSPPRYIPGLVTLQSLILSTSGLLLGICLFFPVIFLVEKISPEVNAFPIPSHFIIVTAGVLVISFLSSYLPNRKIARIYPLEVFT